MMGSNIPVFFIAGMVVLTVGFSVTYRISLVISAFRALRFFSLMLLIGAVITQGYVWLTHEAFSLAGLAGVTGVVMVFYYLTQAAWAITGELVRPSGGGEHG